MRKAYKKLIGPVVTEDSGIHFHYIISVPIYLIWEMTQKIIRSGKYGILSRRLSYIGNNVKIDRSVVVCGPNRVKVGSNVFLGEGVNIDAGRGGAVTIGDNCEIAAGVKIISWNHSANKKETLSNSGHEAEPVVLGENVWVGFDCKILPGVNIGSDVIVAAGSVVNKDVEQGAVVAGSPAKKVGVVDGYEEER